MLWREWGGMLKLGATGRPIGMLALAIASLAPAIATAAPVPAQPRSAARPTPASKPRCALPGIADQLNGRAFTREEMLAIAARMKTEAQIKEDYATQIDRYVDIFQIRNLTPAMNEDLERWYGAEQRKGTEPDAPDLSNVRLTAKQEAARDRLVQRWIIHWMDGLCAEAQRRTSELPRIPGVQ